MRGRLPPRLVFLASALLAAPGAAEAAGNDFRLNTTLANGEGVLFSGDVIFRGSTGRWDLPGGDREQMERSLERVIKLPAATKVYPGHGPNTTIGDEIENLRQLQRVGILPGLRV